MTRTGRTETAGASDWRRRFGLRTVTMPKWAATAPDRLVYTAHANGALQVYTWDRACDLHRQVTAHPNGIRTAAITPDGRTVCWFADRDGDEIGGWLAQPFGDGPITPLIADLPSGWRTGMALGPDGLVAIGLATGEGYEVHFGRIGGATTPLHSGKAFAAPVGFSADGRLIAVAHCEDDGLTGQALRVYDTGGAAVADLGDGPGHEIVGAVFSPRVGDHRVAFLHGQFNLARPGVWDPATGVRRNFSLDLPGDVEIVDWWADTDFLVLVHSHHGRDDIHRLHLADGHLTRIRPPSGTVTGIAIRPDHDPWCRWSTGGTSPRIESLTTRTPVLALDHEEGRPYEAWSFANPAGDTVHGFLVRPDTPAPHPTLFLVHGGPHHHDADVWNPRVQAFADQGWAVAMVNYRGSTGRGRDWLNRTTGDPGRPEVEDLLAARDDLADRGIADPNNIVIAGGSWGGYLTLLTIGTHPSGWRAAVAVAPLADLKAAYTTQATSIRSLLDTLFGGSPADHPALYTERSPLTYAHRVQTPLLIITGENDTRCPIDQIHNYTNRLDEACAPYRLIIYPAGHGPLTVEEIIRQTTAIIEFARQNIENGVGAE